MRRSLSYFILALFSCACASPPQTASIPEGWKKIANSAFSFYAPSTFQKTNARGIDSFVEVYVDDGIMLNFDYGPYSNDLSDWPEKTAYYRIKIGKDDARIGTVMDSFGHQYPYCTQVYVRRVENKNGHDNLSIFVNCRSEKEVAIAHQIFTTITFAPERQNPNY